MLKSMYGYEHVKDIHYCNSRDEQEYVYVMYNFRLPQSISDKLLAIRNYFDSLIELYPDIDYKDRWFKTALDSGDFAIDTLFQLHSLIIKDKPFSLGSQYLNPIAFLSYKKIGQEIIITSRDLLQRYVDHEEVIQKTFIYFRLVDVQHTFHMIRTMVNELNSCVEEILTASISLLYDVIKMCGPDCDIVAHFFINDSGIYRTTDEHVNKWLELRKNHFAGVKINHNVKLPVKTLFSDKEKLRYNYDISLHHINNVLKENVKAVKLKDVKIDDELDYYNCYI